MNKEKYIKIILFILFANSICLNANCIVPNILLKTVQITENETSNPYLIRTNEDVNTFYNIVNRFTYKKQEDKNVIDCLNKENCTYITNSLIENNITNIDLGLHQINYKSYKYPAYTYFDKVQSSINACSIIEDKIKMNKNKWSWEVLASYHSITPHLNRKYKEKLIKNYIKLISQIQN